MAHNQKAVGSNPTPAPNFVRLILLLTSSFFWLLPPAFAQPDSRRQIQATTYMRGLLEISNAPLARLYLGITGTGGGTNGLAGYRVNFNDVRTNTDLVPVIFVGGYSTENDGGGGVFVLTNTITGTNRGTRFEVAGASLSYERVHDGPVNIKWFGATGDGSGGTDDTTAINQAFGYAFTNNFAAYIPRGTFKTTSRLNILSNAKVIGDGANSVLYGATNDIILNVATVTNVLLRDFHLDGAYVIGTYIASATDITLDHIETSGATVAGSTLTAGIDIEGCTRVTLDHPYLHNNGVSSTNLAHDYNILVDFLGVPSADIKIESPRIVNANSKFGIGLYSVADAQVNHFYIDMNNAFSPHGFTGYGLFAYGTAGGPGCNRVSFVDGTITNDADNGIYLNNTVGAEVIGVHLAKVAQQGDDTTLAKSGITITSSANVRVIGNWVTNSGPNPGIVLSSTTNCVVAENEIYLPGTNHFGIALRLYNYGYSIKGNTVWNSHRAIGDVLGNGISDGGDIEGNVIRNAFDGIVLATGSSNTVVRGNRIFNNGDYGILDQGTRNALKENVLVGGVYGLVLAGTNGIAEGNQVTGHTLGLLLSGTGYQIAPDNILSGNTADVSGGPLLSRLTLTGKSFTFPITNAVAGQVLASDGSDPSNYYWTNSSGTASGGETNTSSNLGTQGAAIQGLSSAKSGVDLRFRSLEAGTGITLSSNATTVTITSSAAGESNTASNLGTPSATIQPVYNSKSSADLRFRSIEAGAGVTLTSNANTIALSIAPASSPLNFGDQFGVDSNTNIVIASGASLTNMVLVGGTRAPSKEVGFSTGAGNINAALAQEWTMLLSADSTIGITNYQDDCTIWLTVTNAGSFTLTITNVCYWPTTGNSTQATNDWGAGIINVYNFAKKGSRIIAGKFGLGGGNWLDSGSTNAVLYGNATLNAITATNGITAKDVTASTLLRADSNKKLASVTIGAGMAFDGTTLSSTGVSGWMASAVTNSFLLGNATLNALTATNGITAQDVTASSLLRVDSNKKIAPVTIGSNITFDGTTISASTATGANWLGSGTTNSELAGIARVNSLVVTNAITFQGLVGPRVLAVDGSGIPRISFTSSYLANAITDRSGSGQAIFQTSPSLVTPLLGAATATSIQVTNGITALDVTASTLMRADSAKKLATVTVGSGLAFDGTTISIADNVFNVGTTNAQLNGNLAVNGLTATNVLNVGVGASTGNFAAVGGTLKVDTTATGNVGVGEDNLITYSVPAASLAVNGDFLEWRCSGTFAANGNTKQVKAYFGTTQLFASGAVAFNAGDWVLTIQVIRTGAATQIANATWTSSNASLTSSCLISTPAETLANAITAKLTGEATTTNDIIEKTSTTKYYRGQ